MRWSGLEGPVMAHSVGTCRRCLQNLVTEPGGPGWNQVWTAGRQGGGRAAAFVIAARSPGTGRWLILGLGSCPRQPPRPTSGLGSLIFTGSSPCAATAETLVYHYGDPVRRSRYNLRFNCSGPSGTWTNAVTTSCNVGSCPTARPDAPSLR